MPSVEPRVTIHLAGYKEIHLVLRFPFRTRHKSLLEQSIVRRYLELNEWGVITPATNAEPLAEPDTVQA